MASEDVIYEKDACVAKITLNRPSVSNAVDFQMMQEIDKAVTRAEEDRDIKVIVLRGAGRAFSSGYDADDKSDSGDVLYKEKQAGAGQKLPEKPDQWARLELDRYVADIMRHLFLCTKVTIVQAHGDCLGLGLMLAEKCDLIVASDDCQFGYVDERLTFGGVTMSPMLIYRVGLTKALELSITGRVIKAGEAQRINLINRVVPKNRLETEVDKLAHAIGLYPHDGLAVSKATRHTLYDILGMNQWFNASCLSHTLVSYIDIPRDERDFLKEMRGKGKKSAAREKQDLVRALDMKDYTDEVEPSKDLGMTETREEEKPAPRRYAPPLGFRPHKGPPP